MAKRIYLWTLLLGLVWGLSAPSAVQAAKTSASLNQLKTQIEKDPGVMDQWVQYPEKFLQPMMVAAEYPEALGRLGRLQSKTRGEFQSLIRDLPRAEQEQIYELTRYPQLLDALGGANKLSNGEIKKISAEYPASTQKAALALGRKHYGLLRQVGALNAGSRQEFERNIQDLPANAQNAYRELLQVPELLSSMEENMPMAMAMGEAYRADPGATQRSLEARRTEVERRNQEAAADFNENLKNNPQAEKEMRQAAEQYAKEKNVTVYQVEEVPNTNTVYVEVNPYPYWFGWPYWYPYAWWRPYPYWWGFGFYFGPGWGIGYWGWPSYYYSNWFWGYYPNYYRYPNLCGYYWGAYNRWRPYYGYYNGYWRGYGNGFFRATNSWQQTRGRYVFGNSYTADGRNASRFTQLGRMERDYSQFRTQNPQRTVSRESFYQSRGLATATSRSRSSPATLSDIPGRGGTPSNIRTTGGGGGTTPDRSGYDRSTGGPAPRSGGDFGTERRSQGISNTGAGMEASPRSTGGGYNRGGFGGGSTGGSTIRSGGFGGGSRGGGSFGGGGGFRGGGGGGGFRR